MAEKEEDKRGRTFFRVEVLFQFSSLMALPSCIRQGHITVKRKENEKDTKDSDADTYIRIGADGRHGGCVNESFDRASLLGRAEE
jgi:hypothetical protein